jgi:hypothetical protein
LRESVGHLTLDKIRPYHVTGHLQKLKQKAEGQPHLQSGLGGFAKCAQERED